MRIPKLLRVLLPSIIIVAWFAIGGIGGPYFGRIEEVSSNDQTTFLPASAESTKVNAEISKFKDDKSIPAIVVFSNGDADISTETIAKIAEQSDNIADLPGVVGDVSPPIASDDGKAALVVVNIASDADYKEFVPELEATLTEANVGADFKVSGPVGFLSDLAGAFSGIDGLLLGVALAVVFVILLVVYRSPVLPFIVLINSVFALCVAILAVFYLAKFDVVTLNGQVQGILFILVIGAATDYALLFIARYKEELVKHKLVYEAIIASWKRSIEPIAAAGGTVIVGLLCLLLSDLNSNKALGPVGAIGIAMAIIATMTLLPSLLMMWGRKAFWPRIPKYKLIRMSELPKKGLWPSVAKFVAGRARPIWIITTAVLVIATLGLTQLRADGVPQSEFILGTSNARDGQKIINEHFPGGSGTPTQIIVSADKINDAVTALEADSGVASVLVAANDSPSGTLPLGEEQTKIKRQIRQAVAAQLQAQGGFVNDQIIDSVSANAYPFKDATPKIVEDKVLLEVTLTNDADSDAAQDTVLRLRETMHELNPGSLVGGASAVQLDTRISSERDRLVVIPAVLIAITIILMLLLRSILAPILLLVTTVLSFSAILGISAIVFNDIFNFPGADPSVVLYAFIFLVALGIDYNIFLMTRVREESLKKGTRKGTLIGLIATGSVITSAGIVLAATFAALAVIPILFLAQLAFVVAFGVLIDTIIVRSLLVPALAHDIGKSVWWPSKKHKD